MKNTLTKHMHAPCYHRGGDDTIEKLQGRKEIKMDWIEADYIQPTLMTAVRF